MIFVLPGQMEHYKGIGTLPLSTKMNWGIMIVAAIYFYAGTVAHAFRTGSKANDYRIFCLGRYRMYPVVVFHAPCRDNSRGG